MALKPEQKNKLIDMTLAAKKLIFSAERMRKLLPMLETRRGALQAVGVIMAVIDKQRPIPPDISMFLAVNVYVLMVDFAKDATGRKPDPKIMQQVSIELLKQTLQTYAKKDAKKLAQQPPQSAQQPVPQQPAGLIATQQQGV